LTKPTEKPRRSGTSRDAQGSGFPLLEHVYQGFLGEVEKGGQVRIDAVYYCPHRPDEDCLCRKPRPGLLLRAARELDIDLPGSWLIGDDPRDLESAVAAGVRPALVRTGYGKDLPETVLARAPYRFDVFEDLLEAVTRLAEG